MFRRAWILRGLAAGAVLWSVSTITLAAQPGPVAAQIQAALRAFLTVAHTWTATQTFTNVVVNGTCTGCTGSGTVSGPGSSTVNALARWGNTGGTSLLNSTPVLADDGRITLLTDPTGLQDASTKNYVDTAIAGVNTGGGAAQNSFLVNGGQVVWTSDYNFTVSAATYYINGVLYTAAQQNVTLTAADPTNPRIDQIVVDDTGTVSAVAGTASAQPSAPVIDPGAQLPLTLVTVAAGSTEPADVQSTLLYCDNVGGPTEWNWTTSGTGFNTNSSNNPVSGCSKSIEGTTVAANAYAQGQIPSSTFDPATQNFLVFYIRSKASWNNKRGLTVTLRSSGVQVGQPVTFNGTAFGFDSNQTSTYQQIAIPLLQFAVANGTTITQVRFQDFGGSIGFYLGNVSIQGGVTQPANPGLTREQADALYQPLGASSGAALSAITAATGANTIANGNNHSQVWNWALTTASSTALALGETTAATGGSGASQALLGINLLANSTSAGLRIENFGTAYGLYVSDVASDTSPFVIDADGEVCVQCTTPTVALQVGGALSVASTTTLSGILRFSGGYELGTNGANDLQITTNSGNLRGRWKATIAQLGLAHNGNTTITTTNLHSLAIGEADNDGLNHYYTIGYGWRNGGMPAYTGYQQTNSAGDTCGDLVEGTRPNTTSAPVERLRIYGCSGAAGVFVGDFGTTGVKISTDGDGAITFLGLGNGSDEDWTLNFDDTSNTIVTSSSTGVTSFVFTSINVDAASFSVAGSAGGTGTACSAFTGGICTTATAPGELTPDQQRIADLEAKVAALEARVSLLDRLFARLEALLGL